MSRAELVESVSWSRRPVGWAVRFALHGPRVLPMSARRVPLWLIARAVEVQLRFLGR